MNDSESLILYVCFFDRLNSRIGILPAHTATPKTFPVKTKGKGRHRIIWASPFCKSVGIHFDTVRAFVDPEIDTENFLCLDLLNTTGVSQRKKKTLKGLRLR